MNGVGDAVGGGVYSGSCKQPPTAPSDNNFNVVKMSPAKYEKRADTFVIIQDASSSMNGEYMGRTNIDLAKETLSHFNQTIPQLGFNAGLTAFGTGGCIHKKVLRFKLNSLRPVTFD